MYVKDGGAVGLAIAGSVTAVGAAIWISLVHLVVWHQIHSLAPTGAGVVVLDHPDRMRMALPVAVSLLIGACTVQGSAPPSLSRPL